MTRRGMVLLGAITLVGSGVRLTSPGRIGLWRDEAQALNIASLPSLAEITRFLYAHESHPPLFYYLEHFVGRLTGDATGGMGVVLLLASIALIPAVWWLASLSQVRGAAPVAAALIAVSVPLAFFAVQLRPYALLSLAMVIGAGAILQDRVTPAAHWRALWAAMALGLIYLHHAGTMIVAAQLITAFLLVRPAGHQGGQWWRWAPAVGAVALGAVPALVMLAHQSVSAAYLSRYPIAMWLPALPLRGLIILFRLASGLDVLGAAVCLLSRPRSAGPGIAEDTPQDQVRFAGAMFLVTIGLLAAASYRSNLLVPYVVLAVAPLGMAAAGIMIANAAMRRQRWRSVILAEAAVACVGLSTLAFVGNGKTDTDLMARYVAAEGRPDDLIILAPGALGPSFNRYFAGRQEQIDYPVMGPVARYEFDHDFGRVASLASLRSAFAAIASACRAGRRVWLITPARWIIAPDPPITLAAGALGGLGQADVARANLLERRTARAFGMPPRVIRPSAGGAGVEHLEARLWGAADGSPRPAMGAACDVE